MQISPVSPAPKPLPSTTAPVIAAPLPPSPPEPPAPSGDQAQIASAQGRATLEFDVLSLNTFGLPQPIGKEVAERHSRIGRAIGSYEVIGFQEAFSKDSKHLAQGAALSGLSYHVHTPTDKRLLTSGLSTFSQYPIVASGFKPFTFGSHADALAQKGVSFSRLQLPDGSKVDVYNTHFQAATDKPQGPLDKLWMKSMAQIFPGYDMPREDIRRHNAQVLIDYVKQQDAGHPVIILGDLNTQEHQDILPLIKNELGLQDSFREVHGQDPGYTSDGKTNPYKDNPDKRKRVDYILYRPGQEHTLKVVSSQLAFDQAVDGMFVSDHYGVHTRFQVVPKD